MQCRLLYSALQFEVLGPPLTLPPEIANLRSCAFFVHFNDLCATIYPRHTLAAQDNSLIMIFLIFNMLAGKICYQKYINDMTVLLPSIKNCFV